MINCKVIRKVGGIHPTGKKETVLTLRWAAAFYLNLT
jgi:hypothetical protein